MYIDDIKTIKKVSNTTLELLFSDFHLYVGEFKMNHENKNIIDNEKYYDTTMLLNIISVRFNPDSDHCKIIDIYRYLNFLEHEKINMSNPFSINGLNLCKEVMLIKYYDVFKIAIYQYDKNVKIAYKTTNIMFHSRYPSVKIPSLETVSDG